MSDNVVDGYQFGYPFGGGSPTCAANYTEFINTVKDYNLLEDRTDALSVRLRRSLDVRRVGIDNSTPFHLGIGIHNQRYGCTPPIKFYMRPGEVKWLGLNPPGGNPQYLWVFDMKQQKWANTPKFLDYHENYFAILAGNYREYGINCYSPHVNEDWEPWYWCQGYRQASGPRA